MAASSDEFSHISSRRRVCTNADLNFGLQRLILDTRFANDWRFLPACYRNAMSQVDRYYFSEVGLQEAFENLQALVSRNWVFHATTFIFSNFSLLELHKRKNFLCVCSDSGFINFLAGHILQPGGLNHGVEIMARDFAKCQARVNDIDLNLPRLRTKISFPSFFKDPGVLNHWKEAYDCIFINGCVSEGDARRLAGNLIDGGVMMGPYVYDGSRNIRCLMFMKRGSSVFLSELNRHEHPDICLFHPHFFDDLFSSPNGVQRDDDSGPVYQPETLSTACLRAVSASVKRSVQKKSSDSAGTAIVLDWGWLTYSENQRTFDEIYSQAEVCLRAVDSFLTQLRASEPRKCLEASREVAATITELQSLQYEFSASYHRLLLDFYKISSIESIARLWVSAVGIALEQSMSFLQRSYNDENARVCLPDLTTELARLDADVEKEEFLNLFDSTLTSNSATRNLIIGLGLSKAVGSRLLESANRILAFITANLTVSINELCAEHNRFRIFSTTLHAYQMSVKSWEKKLAQGCQHKDLVMEVKSCTDGLKSVHGQVVRLAIDGELEQIENRDETQQRETMAVMKEYLFLSRLQESLYFHFKGICHRDLQYMKRCPSTPLSGKEIDAVCAGFSRQENGNAKWSSNIPQLALCWKRHLTSLLTQKPSDEENAVARYHRIVEDNGMNFPPGIRDMRSKMHDML